jgi:hypothetical protein
LLQDEHECRRSAGDEAAGSYGQRSVASQECINCQAQRYRQQRDPQGVEWTPVRVIRLGNDPWHCKSQRQAKRDVGVKDPTPTEPRGEQAAQGRAQGHGNAGNHAYDAERPRPLTLVRKRTGDECKCTRDHEGCTDALHDPRSQELRAAGRQATGD